MATVLKFGVAMIAGWLVLTAIQSAYTHAMQTAISDRSTVPGFSTSLSPTVSVAPFSYDPDCSAVDLGLSTGKPPNVNRCHAEQGWARTATSPQRP